MDWSQQWHRLVVVPGIVLLSVAAFGTCAGAGELGHYAPALFNIRDFVRTASAAMR
jgi:hypothetical protein